ncbi:hypothetical protein BV25DRAFT_1819496 [Artomyces pyxidatus]|uniref:Uncharacterized protein n=1 Tax=Artomyces pyxidatus TaxID=48021 RepID=A0ACB8TFP1_9AGAM|nr:hypothetical protein BV25DRAFT_1819496 [Artomyces pyxidatus]
MAETLLAIVLVTSSAKGGGLVCRWPPSPQSSPRLARPRPDVASEPAQFDNPWRASHSTDGLQENASARREQDDWEYIWQRPNKFRDRSVSFSHSTSHSHSHSAPSGRTSPTKDGAYEFDDTPDDTPLQDDFDDFFGYSSEFLASLLCPKRSLCHQKFELAVDDLCFIGHPVCAESDGMWRFKPEKAKADIRGRGSKKRRTSGEDVDMAASIDLEGQSQSPMMSPVPAQKSSWLQTFHVVFVHDLPDPSSSASGNLQKYFDVIYQQVAFTLTAVLFQEQVLSNFVEMECDTLGALKDDFASKGSSFEAYMQQALVVSSIAPAIKILYESIKSRSLAHLTIHNLPLELQLPPYLDSLLHSEGDSDFADLAFNGDEPGVDGNPWGQELGFAWRLPSLEPWKSLLLLGGPEGKEWMDVYASIRGSNVRDEDKMLAEQLIKFLEMADVTLSLVDMASLLDWDLESQVFPIVRWLVHHRRAKIVDIVHRGLKTVFTLPLKFEAPLKQLEVEFRQAFPDTSVPSLPQLLSTISSSSSNHFYATVVKSKDLVPLYRDVVLWMLQRDLLVTLHLRIRIVVPAELKAKVPRRKIRWKEDGKSDVFQTRGRKKREASEDEQDLERELDNLFESPRWFPLSPKGARERAQRGSTSSSRSQVSEIIEPPILEEGIELDEEIEEKDAEETTGEEEEEGGHEEDERSSSMISDPGRATYRERQWLQAMSEGKDHTVARRFEQINQYFDGKCTDNEILFRAEISRKQLREVLHHYDEFLQTFLHPS